MPKVKKNCKICKKEFWFYYRKDRPNEYCSSQCYWQSEKWNKGKKFPQLRGENACHWKDGKIMSNGYVHIYSPKHPFVANKRYVLEHRLVMERYIGRYLTPEEIVHHINEIKTDNRIENLMLFANDSEHGKHHLLLKQRRKTNNRTDTGHQS